MRVFAQKEKANLWTKSASSAKARLPPKESTDAVHQLAHDGTAGNASSLPYLDQIQQSFGPAYDLRPVGAHFGSQAGEAARRLGAEAYATGEQVVFSSAPNLRTAAHEAAHVVQQRRGIQLKGGVGESGDPYERHADAVADTVVGGGSAESLLNRIPSASASYAGRPQVQCREDIEIEARQMMHDVERRAQGLVGQYRSDPAGLATMLISDLSTTTGILDDWERSQVAYRVLRDFPNQAGLGNAIARQLPNDRVRQLATQPRNGLSALAMTVLRGGNMAEAERIMSIVVGPAHGHLFGETASQSAAVQHALGTHGARLQSITGGTAGTVFDEYWIIMDAMPPNLTAEAYLTEMTQDLNAAVRSEAFDDINEFRRTQQDQQRGAPAVGDVYDIDIQGPDNGSVILVERTPDHFIFQTVATTQTGAHPEFGSRNFGFEMLENGAVRWYTRGVSRAGSDVAAIIGAPIQERGWTAMLTGIGNTLQSRGGRLRPRSFGHWIRRQ